MCSRKHGKTNLMHTIKNCNLFIAGYHACACPIHTNKTVIYDQVCFYKWLIPGLVKYMQDSKTDGRLLVFINEMK